MKPTSGFTLIEISIVLVIIGLIVGGILVGQDMISAAAIRAQISQIEKYNTAVHTFQNKYGYLPGDIPDPYASNFGFQARGQWQGEGDGNGIIEGNNSNTAGGNLGWQQCCGELAVFWSDLSTANLIDANIFGCDTHGANYPCSVQTGTSPTLTTSPGIKDWLPIAKLGTANFVYLYSFSGINYFSVSTVTRTGNTVESTADPGLTVQQAYNIDTKIDDGLPQSGNIWTCYVNFNAGREVWAAAGLHAGRSGGNINGSNCVPATGATIYQSYNCFDNNGVAGPQKYSLTQNANLLNCALSFKMQ